MPEGKAFLYQETNINSSGAHTSLAHPKISWYIEYIRSALRKTVMNWRNGIVNLNSILDKTVFHFVLMPFGEAWTHLFSSQLWQTVWVI